jgi:hypothetical protein
MCSDVEVNDLPSMVSQDNETEQDSKSNSGNCKEVDRDDLSNLTIPREMIQQMSRANLLWAHRESMVSC